MSLQAIHRVNLERYAIELNGMAANPRRTSTGPRKTTIHFITDFTSRNFSANRGDSASTIKPNWRWEPGKSLAIILPQDEGYTRV